MGWEEEVEASSDCEQWNLNKNAKIRDLQLLAATTATRWLTSSLTRNWHTDRSLPYHYPLKQPMKDLQKNTESWGNLVSPTAWFTVKGLAQDPTKISHCSSTNYEDLPGGDVDVQSRASSSISFENMAKT